MSAGSALSLKYERNRCPVYCILYVLNSNFAMCLLLVTVQPDGRCGEPTPQQRPPCTQGLLYPSPGCHPAHSAMSLRPSLGWKPVCAVLSPPPDAKALRLALGWKPLWAVLSSHPWAPPAAVPPAPPLTTAARAVAPAPAVSLRSKTEFSVPTAPGAEALPNPSEGSG